MSVDIIGGIEKEKFIDDYNNLCQAHKEEVMEIFAKGSRPVDRKLKELDTLIHNIIENQDKIQSFLDGLTPNKCTDVCGLVWRVIKTEKSLDFLKKKHLSYIEELTKRLDIYEKKTAKLEEKVFVGEIDILGKEFESSKENGKKL
jgi:hypothetical protein